MTNKNARQHGEAIREEEKRFRAHLPLFHLNLPREEEMKMIPILVSCR